MTHLLAPLSLAPLPSRKGQFSPCFLPPFLLFVITLEWSCIKYMLQDFSALHYSITKKDFVNP